MRRGTRFRLFVAFVLVGAIAGRLHHPVGARTGNDRYHRWHGGRTEKVVFTWGSAGETSSLNPMSGYLGLDFYFWMPQYYLLIDWATGLLR